MTGGHDASALRAREYPWMNDGAGIYLNAASTGPMPASAVAAADEWTRLRAQPQRIALSRMQDAAATARAQFAALVGAAADEIALMPNTTYGLNLAARALPFAPGVLLTFAGEFPSCVYPFQALVSRGLTLELIPLRDALPDEDALVAAIAREDVSGVVVSWVQFATGFVADLERIGAACRARGIPFVVDGIQGCAVLPIDLHALPVDMFATGAQKWQLSPWGTGFVYVRRALLEQLEPHDVGWACMTAAGDYGRLTDYRFDFWPDARRFEVVTLAYHDFAVANVSTRLLLDVGPAAAEAHIASLLDVCFAWSDTRTDVRVITPRDRTRRAGVFAFAVPEMGRAMQTLKRLGVAFVVREGYIRLSPHVYNTREEMERVVAAL
jgi:selenocysteine lyase/cysteine desulfurase